MIGSFSMLLIARELSVGENCPLSPSSTRRFSRALNDNGDDDVSDPRAAARTAVKTLKDEA